MWVESANSIILFWHAQKLRQSVYLRDFSFVIYRKFNSNFPALFLAFFDLSWTFGFRDEQKLKLEFIFQSSKYCHLSKFQIVLFLPIQTFFWSSNCTILVCKLCHLFQTILDLWSVLIFETFSSWNIKKGQFQFLVTFLAIFFWSVNCTSALHIITYFAHEKYFIWGFLVGSFLVFNVFKYLKFTPSSNFSWSWNVEVLVCKWYIPGLWIILLFWKVRNFGQYLHLSVFSKHWKWPTFSISKIYHA